ncbi:MAG: exodeoxyribonuclease VII large subunit, partial [Arenicellales bacterium]
TARTRLLDRLNQDLTQQHHRLTQAAAQLKALSPSATLDRGFAIVQVAGKEAVVRSATVLKPGDAIITRFANGTANAEVTSTQPKDS